MNGSLADVIREKHLFPEGKIIEKLTNIVLFKSVLSIDDLYVCVCLSLSACVFVIEACSQPESKHAKEEYRECLHRYLVGLGYKLHLKRSVFTKSMYLNM